MVETQVDEFSAWQRGATGKLQLLSGYITAYKVDAVARWITPDLDSIAQTGDPIAVVQGTIFSKHILGIVNLNDGAICWPSFGRMFLIGWSVPCILGLIGILNGHSIVPMLLMGVSAIALFVMHRTAIRALNEAAASRDVLMLLCRRDVRRVEMDRWQNAPDVDSRALMLAAWRDEMPHGRQRAGGRLKVGHGKLLIGDPGWLEGGLSVDVPQGVHAITLAIGTVFDRHGRDAGESLSYAFLTVDSSAPVSTAENMGTFGVDSGLACIIPASDAERFKTTFGRGDIENFTMALISEIDKDTERYSGCLSLADGTMMACLGNFGGDGSFPVWKLLDQNGKTVAIAISFEG